jgi:hypothetical protein
MTYSTLKENLNSIFEHDLDELNSLTNTISLANKIFKYSTYYVNNLHETCIYVNKYPTYGKVKTWKFDTSMTEKNLYKEFQDLQDHLREDTILENLQVEDRHSIL